MNQKFSLDKFIQRHDHVVWKVLDDKGILLNLDDGAYFEVNAVGLAIWEKCDGRTSLKGIISSLQTEFEIDLKRLTDDVDEFVDALRENRMAEVLSMPENLNLPPR